MNDKMISAKKAFQDKKFERALELYEQEISEHPDNVDAYLGAGHSLFVLKRFKKAIALAEHLLSLDSGNAMAHVILAEAYENLKEVSKSRSEIQLAYSLAPKNPSVLASYGVLLLYNEKWKEGIGFLEKALDEDHQMLLAVFNLAFAYQKLGNAEETLYYTKKIYELRPSVKNRIRLIYARLNRTGFLKPLFSFVILLFIVFAIFHEFVLFGITGLILLLVVYFRISFQTP